MSSSYTEKQLKAEKELKELILLDELDFESLKEPIDAFFERHEYSDIVVIFNTACSEDTLEEMYGVKGVYPLIPILLKLEPYDRFNYLKNAYEDYGDHNRAYKLALLMNEGVELAAFFEGVKEEDLEAFFKEKGFFTTVLSKGVSFINHQDVKFMYSVLPEDYIKEQELKVTPGKSENAGSLLFHKMGDWGLTLRDNFFWNALNLKTGLSPDNFTNPYRIAVPSIAKMFTGFGYNAIDAMNFDIKWHRQPNAGLPPQIRDKAIERAWDPTFTNDDQPYFDFDHNGKKLRFECLTSTSDLKEMSRVSLGRVNSLGEGIELCTGEGNFDAVCAKGERRYIVMKEMEGDDVVEHLLLIPLVQDEKNPDFFTYSDWVDFANNYLDRDATYLDAECIAIAREFLEHNGFVVPSKNKMSYFEDKPKVEIEWEIGEVNPSKEPKEAVEEGAEVEEPTGPSISLDSLIEANLTNYEDDMVPDNTFLEGGEERDEGEEVGGELEVEVEKPKEIVKIRGIEETTQMTPSVGKLEEAIAHYVEHMGVDVNLEKEEERRFEGRSEFEVRTPFGVSKSRRYKYTEEGAENRGQRRAMEFKHVPTKEMVSDALELYDQVIDQMLIELGIEEFNRGALSSIKGKEHLFPKAPEEVVLFNGDECESKSVAPSETHVSGIKRVQELNITPDQASTLPASFLR